MKYAILIDAGFVKQRLGSTKKPIGVQTVVAVIDRICAEFPRSDQMLYRVFFYDAPPFQKTVKAPLGKKRVDLGKLPLVKANLRLHKDLASVDFLSLRMGETRMRGWKVKSQKLPSDQSGVEITPDDIEPNIQQKGVDMRIGLDIASLVLKKQVDMVVLVSSDSDFVPPLKFARREGVQVALVLLGTTNYHESIIEHSDFVIDINIADLNN